MASRSTEVEGIPSQIDNRQLDLQLQHIRYYANEVRRGLYEKEIAIRGLEQRRTQDREQHKKEKVELEIQILALRLDLKVARQQSIATEQAHTMRETQTSELERSSDQSHETAREKLGGGGMEKRCQELEAVLRSLQEENRDRLGRFQSEKAEWTNLLASLSHRCESMEVKLRSLGYEMDSLGKMKRTRRTARKRSVAMTRASNRLSAISS